MLQLMNILAAAEQAVVRLAPVDATWAGALIIGIVAMFVAAAMVGWAVRRNMPEELPYTHTHDEPPGASHHHGAGGVHGPGSDVHH
jgi:hypothetical protein